MCLDAFLFYFTILPLRVLTSVLGLLFRFLTVYQSHIADVLKLVALVCNVLLLRLFDYSEVYHFVRGEELLKLFVVYNMLEIFDRLCSTFGQDFQDAALYSATDPQISLTTSYWEKCRLIAVAIGTFAIYIGYLCT